jgi:putative pyrroloquinoline-quinone binding quinoprotein
VVAGGVVYFGSYGHKVYALDAATGSLTWSFTTGNHVASSPAVVSDVVYIGSDDGKLYALDAATGSLKWSYKSYNETEADQGEKAIMLPDVQDTTRTREDRTWAATNQQQMSAPAAPWRGWSPLLRVLGLAVALGGGVVLSVPQYLPSWLSGVLVVLLEVVVLGLVASVLLRTGWALLIVPILFSVGFYVGNVIQMYGLDLQRLFDLVGLFKGLANGTVEGVDILLLLGVLPIECGVAIGIPIGKWMEKRLGLGG